MAMAHEVRGQEVLRETNVPAPAIVTVESMDPTLFSDAASPALNFAREAPHLGPSASLKGN